MDCRVLKNKACIITTGYSSVHQAVDIVGENYTTDSIIAHSAGTVEWCQSGLGNLQGSTGNTSYGNCVKILHENGYRTLYAHMSYITVSTGQAVSAGQTLGYMGNTGNSYGAHLHFEVRDKTDSKINPISYLNTSLPSMSSSTEANISYEELKYSSGSEGSKSYVDMAYSGTESCQILVESGDSVLLPVLVGEISLEQYRKNNPSSLTFNCLVDDILQLNQGSAVSFKYNNLGLFYGYIFKISQTSSTQVQVTCYDQLRYFKNSTSMIYKEKTYSQLLQSICEKYQLKVASIESSGYVLPNKIEQSTIFDILGNASDETYNNVGKLFVLYDDFGGITLKNVNSMIIPNVLDESNIGSYSYISSIDSAYNKVSIGKSNTETGAYELYVANDEDAQNAWGILEYHKEQSSLEDSELTAMAENLLEQYCTTRQSLCLEDCIGNPLVRAGSCILVELDIMGHSIKDLMLVEKVVHSFGENSHLMSVDLSGVGFEY